MAFAPGRPWHIVVVAVTIAALSPPLAWSQPLTTNVVPALPTGTPSAFSFLHRPLAADAPTHLVVDARDHAPIGTVAGAIAGALWLF